MNNNREEWNRSYENKDNFLFNPQEEVIRFVSKYICKRIGMNEFREVVLGGSKGRVLDLGCGIGRHVIYCHDMGLDAYGIDLSDAAIKVAREYAMMKGLSASENKIRQGDVRLLPWNDGFFQYAISHGVLDSMPFEIARSACVELARVMLDDGLFYCDLISGDDSQHAREFAGEEVVSTSHEKDTIQLYFNMTQILSIFDGIFKIEECHLIRRENVLGGGYSSRYFLVLRKI